MKKRAALVSIVSNTSLVLIKTFTGLVTGSIAVLSEAFHSGTDLMASLMAFLAVREAERPADEQHPFGHGKFENLSGLFESALILVASGFIYYESIKRLIVGSELRMAWLALAVMAFSAVINLIVSWYLFRVSRKTDSIALEADARHLRADVYSSSGVFIGLGTVHLTGLQAIDPLVGAVIATFILLEGMMLGKRSIEGLLDRALPPEEIEIIREVLDAHRGVIKEYHELKTRKAGSDRHIELHMVVCREERIEETHRTMDSIEKALRERLPRSRVVIHPEPCTHHSEECPQNCYWLSIRKHSEESQNS